jgi:hypothetical protein
MPLVKFGSSSLKKGSLLQPISVNFFGAIEKAGRRKVCTAKQFCGKDPTPISLRNALNYSHAMERTIKRNKV